MADEQKAPELWEWATDPDNEFAVQGGVRMLCSRLREARAELAAEKAARDKAERWKARFKAALIADIARVEVAERQINHWQDTVRARGYDGAAELIQAIDYAEHRAKSAERQLAELQESLRSQVEASGLADVAKEATNEP